MPKTWEDLVAAGKKIVAKKGKDVDGFAFNGGSDANMSLSPFVWSAGGDFAAFEGGKWVGKLTEPGFKEGFQYYTDLVTKHGVSRKSALTQNSVDIATRFANGKVGMYVTGGWDITTIKEQSGGKVDESKMAFFSLPAKDGSGPAPAFPGGNDIAIWKDTKDIDLSAEYYKSVPPARSSARARQGGRPSSALPGPALAEYATDTVHGAVRRRPSRSPRASRSTPTGPRPANQDGDLQAMNSSVIEGPEDGREGHRRRGNETRRDPEPVVMANPSTIARDGAPLRPGAGAPRSAKPPRRSSGRPPGWSPTLLLLPGLLVIAGLLLYPLFQWSSMSFQNVDNVRQLRGDLPSPCRPGELPEDSSSPTCSSGPSLRNTVVFAVVTWRSP